MLSKDEFIARAADGILKARGFEPDGALPGLVLVAVEDATAALEAVGAWEVLAAVRLLIGDLEHHEPDGWMSGNVHSKSFDAALAAIAVAESK